MRFIKRLFRRIFWIFSNNNDVWILHADCVTDFGDHGTVFAVFDGSMSREDIAEIAKRIWPAVAITYEQRFFTCTLSGDTIRFGKFFKSKLNQVHEMYDYY